MIGNKDDEQAKGDDPYRGAGVAVSRQIQSGAPEGDGRAEWDHREHPGQCRKRNDVRQTCRGIGKSDHDAFGEPDQHQTGHGTVHRCDHVASNPFAAWAEEVVAEPHQLATQGFAVAKQEKQREQRK